MPFRIPQFPILCNVYPNVGGAPGAVRLHDQPCQLRAPGKQSSGQDAAHGWAFLSLVLLPKGTDVRDYSVGALGDFIECPAGSLRYYLVEYVEDVAKGFSNEYRTATVTKAFTWPVPIP